MLHKVRRAVPEANVVVISSAAGRPKRIAGVDAYLERGMSLAALSAILGGLFAAEDLALAAAGAGGVVAASGAGRSPEPRGGVARFVAGIADHCGVGADRAHRDRWGKRYREPTPRIWVAAS